MILSDFQNNILQQIIQAFMESKTAGRFPGPPRALFLRLTFIGRGYMRAGHKDRKSVV